jgi:hypothetical protein
MEVTDEMAQYMFWRLWPTGRVPLCPDTGLPDKLEEDRFYDLFLAMWDARHSWEDVSEEHKDRFRRFLLTDEVIHRELQICTLVYLWQCALCFPFAD